MEDQLGQAEIRDDRTGGNHGSYDYAQVNSIARIALYDDLLSAPRIIEVQPAPTAEFIENLASQVYTQGKNSGGTIPYTVIQEVTENFIHARFTEVTVSILDGGKTIRFADQGPGIVQKEKAQLPGFTSAVEPMKRYIRGVGSGLPIVKEYLDFSHGTITIDDNLITGSVVTISLKERPPEKPSSQASSLITADSSVYSKAQDRIISSLIAPLSHRERDILTILSSEGPLGVTDIQKMTGFPISSTHSMLSKLEQAGIISKTYGAKRELTDLGRQAADSL